MFWFCSKGERRRFKCKIKQLARKMLFFILNLICPYFEYTCMYSESLFLYATYILKHQLTNAYSQYLTIYVFCVISVKEGFAYVVH